MAKDTVKINNTDDLRQCCIDTIEKILNKEITPSVANSVLNSVGKIVSITKMEIEYNRYVKKLNGSMPLQIGQ